MIPQQKIQEILSNARVEEVISDFVNLKKRGVNYIGLCPFHDEKTPSFIVSPTKEIYKCFGCGKAGNAVGFLMEHEKFTYPEALKFLADKYNIEVVEEKLTEEEVKEKDEIASIFIVLTYAQKFYHDYLINSDAGKSIGLKYLENRGIGKELVTKFGIGFCPGEINTFTKKAISEGYNEKYLLDSGLSIKSSQGELIDRFRERVIFPIRSVTGRVLGFGGRTLKTDKKEAKYINSPETKIYNKSHVLFGLDLAKDQIRRSDECYLVEGYTDVIGLHKKGIHNVVASLGTSLTQEHTKLVKRYTNNLTFIFDGDEAGIKASLRGIDIALKNELNIKAIALPDGEDPDSFSSKNDQEDLNNYFENNSLDFILFKTKLLIQGKNADPIRRADAIKNIIKSVAIIPNHINRSNYIKTLSREIDLDEETLYRELNNQLISLKKDKSKVVSQKQEEVPEYIKPEQNNFLSSITLEQERIILKLLLSQGSNLIEENVSFAERIFEEISESDFDNPIFQKIFNSYSDYFDEKGIHPDIKFFISHPDPEIQSTSSEFALDILDLSENWSKKLGYEVNTEFNYKKELTSSLKHFELRKLQSLLKQNNKDLKSQDLEQERLELLLKTHQKLKEDIHKISRELGISYY